MQANSYWYCVFIILRYLELSQYYKLNASEILCRIVLGTILNCSLEGVHFFKCKWSDERVNGRKKPVCDCCVFLLNIVQFILNRFILMLEVSSSILISKLNISCVCVCVRERVFLKEYAVFKVKQFVPVSLLCILPCQVTVTVQYFLC